MSFKQFPDVPPPPAEFGALTHGTAGAGPPRVAVAVVAVAAALTGPQVEAGVRGARRDGPVICQQRQRLTQGGSKQKGQGPFRRGGGDLSMRVLFVFFFCFFFW